MIYTASFKIISRLTGYCQLAISCGVPKWYTGGRYRKLSPPFYMVRLQQEIVKSGEWKDGDVNSLCQTYYNEVLSELDPHQVYDELRSIAGSRPIVLLSQETADEFSIRYVLSAWFKQAGIECEEIR